MTKLEQSARAPRAPARATAACSSGEPQPATSSANPGANWCSSGTNGAGGALSPAMRAPTRSGRPATVSRARVSASTPWSAPQKKRPSCTSGPTSCSGELELGDHAEVAAAAAEGPEAGRRSRRPTRARPGRRPVTTSADDEVVACSGRALRVSQPMPPPRVRPPMPVWLMKPPGTARPCCCVAPSRSAHVAPPPQRARRAGASTVTSAHRAEVDHDAVVAHAEPAKLCPPPRTESLEALAACEGDGRAPRRPASRSAR